MTSTSTLGSARAMVGTRGAAAPLPIDGKGSLAMHLEGGDPTTKRPSSAPKTSAGPATFPSQPHAVNLSDIAGGRPADNYVGIARAEPGGKMVTTEVRLRAIVYEDERGPRILGIEAVGPVVTADGKFVSERFKTYRLTNAGGKPITDIAGAKARARALIANGAITTDMTPDPRLVKAHDDRINRLQVNMAQVGNTRLKAPGIDYSNRSDKPNTMTGNSPQARRVERGQWNASWQTQSRDGSPTFSAMIVPNVVGELGPKKAAGKPTRGIGVTPQPFTGFFPVSGGGKDYFTESQNRALYRSTLHPAGFYPGDPNWGRWSGYLKNDPAQAPEYRVSNYGQTSRIRTENWWQVYWNSPNLLAPWVGGSVNARAIAGREEVRAGLYSQQDTTSGRTDTQWLLSLYAWAQAHAKGGVGSAVLPSRSPYETVGVQGEVGTYLYLNTTPFESPFGRTDPAKLKVKDWHIVNGSVTDDHSKFVNQFDAIRQRTGLQMLSESVVPDWDDRSAGVYLQIPREGGGDDSWRRQIQSALIEVKGLRFLPLDKLADVLHRLGRELPQYKEFKFVSEASLRRLNAERVVALKDARTGREIKAIPADLWANSGARVSVGGPGIFLPDDVAQGR